jgi:hypothetical protein
VECVDIQEDCVLEASLETRALVDEAEEEQVEVVVLGHYRLKDGVHLHIGGLVATLVEGSHGDGVPFEQSALLDFVEEINNMTYRHAQGL